MQQLKLPATARKGGRPEDEKLAQDDIKGVVYGPDTEATPIVANFQQLTKLFGQASTNHVVQLEIEGQDTFDVLFKEIQRDPVTNQIRHFDLYAFKKGQKLHATVPINLVGDSPAVIRGAQLSQFLDAVDVECIPSKIPEQFELDISQLEEIGDALHVADISVGADITILSDVEQTVARIEEIRELEVEDTTAIAEEDAESEADETGEEESGGDDAAESEAETTSDDN